MSDLDDFDLGPTLGEMAKPKRGRGRPKSARTLALEARKALNDQVAEAEEHNREIADTVPTASPSHYGNAEEFMKPLTASQLAQIFRMDRKTAQSRLRDCPAKSKTGRGTMLYDIAIAAQYLVEPKVDIEAWIRKLRPNDLPPYLHDAFWAALEKRQRVEQKAGDLWETDKVIDVFGDLAKRIKSTVTLWTDQLEKVDRLTPEQRDFFTAKCDGLLGMVFEAFTSLQEERDTGSLLTRYRNEATGEKGSVKPEDIE